MQFTLVDGHAERLFQRVLTVFTVDALVVENRRMCFELDHALYYVVFVDLVRTD